MGKRGFGPLPEAGCRVRTNGARMRRCEWCEWCDCQWSTGCGDGRVAARSRWENAAATARVPQPQPTDHPAAYNPPQIVVSQPNCVGMVPEICTKLSSFLWHRGSGAPLHTGAPVLGGGGPERVGPSSAAHRDLWPSSSYEPSQREPFEMWLPKLSYPSKVQSVVALAPMVSSARGATNSTRRRR